MEEDVVTSDGEGSLFMKYDEKFLYFYVEGFDSDTDTLYIPIDTNPKIGSTYCQNYDLTFERESDFIICIDGRENSRVVVQERYEALNSTYGEVYYAHNPYYPDNRPQSSSPVFCNIYMPLTLTGTLPTTEDDVPTGEKYETGKLRYGNANPDSEDFDSLADFCFTDSGVEIRIPWQLLNFFNPSEMMIHDDYYECYGIEGLHIDEMYVGMAAGDAAEYRIPMAAFALEGWGKTVTYHERLKESYYILQEYWVGLDG